MSDSDKERLIHTLVRALKDASDHLDYCGYGDRWERECADSQKLPEKIETAMKMADEMGYVP